MPLAERQTIRFNGDRFVRVSLEETRSREETNLDVWNVERRDLEESKVSKLIVDGPSDFALAFNLQAFGDSFELRDRSWRRDWFLRSRRCRA